MTGLKNKNGALQRDKLKMGIGENERMTEAQRDTGSDRVLTMQRDRYGEIRGRRMKADTQANGGEIEVVMVHRCFIVDAALASARPISPSFSLAHSLTHSLTYSHTISFSPFQPIT